MNRHGLREVEEHCLNLTSTFDISFDQSNEFTCEMMCSNAVDHFCLRIQLPCFSEYNEVPLEAICRIYIKIQNCSLAVFWYLLLLSYSSVVKFTGEINTWIQESVLLQTFWRTWIPGSMLFESHRCFLRHSGTLILHMEFSGVIFWPVGRLSSIYAH